MTPLIVSTSLNNDSRSRQLAELAREALLQHQVAADFLDLRSLSLPICDGDAAYAHPSVKAASRRIADAAGILLAFPVYNYTAGSSVKNLLELTGGGGGGAWRSKVVGLMYTGGGTASYMASLSLANALMLDFQCLIVPRLVYATGDDLPDNQPPSASLVRRVGELVEEFLRIARALAAPRIPGG